MDLRVGVPVCRQAVWVGRWWWPAQFLGTPAHLAQRQSLPLPPAGRILAGQVRAGKWHVNGECVGWGRNERHGRD